MNSILSVCLCVCVCVCVKMTSSIGSTIQLWTAVSALWATIGGGGGGGGCWVWSSGESTSEHNGLCSAPCLWVQAEQDHCTYVSVRACVCVCVCVCVHAHVLWPPSTHWLGTCDQRLSASDLSHGAFWSSFSLSLSFFLSLPLLLPLSLSFFLSINSNGA